MTKWISVKDRLPKHSTAMETYRVIVWDSERKYWTVGYYIGGCLQQWRIEGSPNAQENISYWAEITSPGTQVLYT